jgi:hypothetical protein
MLLFFITLFLNLVFYESPVFSSQPPPKEPKKGGPSKRPLQLCEEQLSQGVRFTGFSFSESTTLPTSLDKVRQEFKVVRPEEMAPIFDFLRFLQNNIQKECEQIERDFNSQGQRFLASISAQEFSPGGDVRIFVDERIASRIVESLKRDGFTIQFIENIPPQTATTNTESALIDRAYPLVPELSVDPLVGHAHAAAGAVVGRSNQQRPSGLDWLGKSIIFVQNFYIKHKKLIIKKYAAMDSSCIPGFLLILSNAIPETVNVKKQESQLFQLFDCFYHNTWAKGYHDLQKKLEEQKELGKLPVDFKINSNMYIEALFQALNENNISLTANKDGSLKIPSEILVHLTNRTIHIFTKKLEENKSTSWLPESEEVLPRNPQQELLKEQQREQQKALFRAQQELLIEQQRAENERKDQQRARFENEKMERERKKAEAEEKRRREMETLLLAQKQKKEKEDEDRQLRRARELERQRELNERLKKREEERDRLHLLRIALLNELELFSDQLLKDIHNSKEQTLAESQRLHLLRIAEHQALIKLSPELEAALENHRNMVQRGFEEFQAEHHERFVAPFCKAYRSTDPRNSALWKSQYPWIIWRANYPAISAYIQQLEKQRKNP